MIAACPTCGSTVRVVSGDEGTSHYEPAGTPAGRVELPTVYLLHAFRYALGRMSYVVGNVADDLIAHADKLEPEWREQIIRDIGDAIDRNAAGMNMDVEQWTRVGEAMAAANKRT